MGIRGQRDMEKHRVGLDPVYRRNKLDTERAVRRRHSRRCLQDAAGLPYHTAYNPSNSDHGVHLNLGFFMNAGFDQVFNMMNDAVINHVDIIDTYVYRIGLQKGNFSLATAAGLFKGIIGLILILSTDRLSRKISGEGVW